MIFKTKKGTIPAASVLLFMLVALLYLGSSANAQNKVTGIVKVASTPKGATVKVDGKVKGNTPLLLELTEGKHRMVLQYKGYEETSRILFVTKNKLVKTHVKMTKRVPKPKKTVSMNTTASRVSGKDIVVHTPETSAEPGTILLATTPSNLSAYIDGFLIPKATPVAFDIRPGIYELTLKNARNDVVYRKTVFVRPGDTVDLNIVVKKQRTIDYSDPWI